ncbi:MAG TPA: hypothetical protein VK163_01735 [Opitutaceae bacterium]|nr:hypothetical protein [Opitutaceae bacterium]
MDPLHLLVHSANPANAARIEQALRSAVPDCQIELLTDANALALRLRDCATESLVVDASGATATPPMISPALRHDLNNHLALIRMLADLLADNRTAPPSFAAKAREIAAAADAAAQTLRRTKQPEG